MTLAQTLLPARSLPVQAALILVGSVLITLSARIEVPMYPVPMTLQTLTISLIGLTYGGRLAALTVLAYLAQGAAGLPVFSGGNAGLAWLVAGPTAGFLWGFVAMAWATGWLAERTGARGLAGLFAVAVVPAFGLFVFGAGWPLLAAQTGLSAPWTQMSAAAVWGAFVVPFLLGTLVKSAIAALIVTGAWKATPRR